MTEYYDIAFVFPVVGVAPKLVLEELAILNDLVDLLPNTLEIGDTEGYVEGHFYEDDWDVIDWDVIVAVCEANEAVKIAYATISEWICDVEWEAGE